MNYEEYSALPAPPSLKELENLILDKDPLVELWDCGSITEFKDLPGQLNTLIKRNKLHKTCKRIK
jgi:hypothetical protein